MLTAEAHVETERPSRYLVQLCRHTGQMSRHLPRLTRDHEDGEAPPEVRQVDWSDNYGVVRLDLGQVTLRATADTLTLHAEADNEQDLRRIRDLLTARLEKIGRRDHLTINWQRPDPPPDPPGESRAPGQAARHRGRGWVISLAVVGTLFVAAHLGLGGTLLAASPWTGWAIDGVLAIVAVKVIVLGCLAVRRPHRSAGPGRHLSRRS